MIKKWKIQDRKRVFHSKFVSVYSDKVRLSNGKIIPDYTVVKKKEYVMVVATDTKNRLIIEKEYKHGSRQVHLTLPAGLIDEGENPVQAAKRELEEETGYTKGKFKLIAAIYEDPAKIMSRIYVVRATGLSVRNYQKLEDTEDIEVNLITVAELKKQIKQKKWSSCGALAAFVLSGLLF